MASLVGAVCLTNSFSDGSVLTTADDGQIAVVSEGGVYTLVCDASPLNQLPTLCIQISKIDAVSDVFLPVSDLNQKDRLAFDNAVEFTLDHTLNILTSCNSGNKTTETNKTDSPDKSKKTDLEGQKSKAEQRGPRQARWSPRNADIIGNCLLAILWFDHRLIVYGDFSKDRLWHKVADVSELWKTKATEYLLKPDQKPRPGAKEIKFSTHLEKLKEDCYMRATVAVAWSSLYEQLEFDELEEPSKRIKLQPDTDFIRRCKSLYALLAVALKSGCTVLWKVGLPAESDRDFSVVSILDFGCNLPSELLFIPVNDSLTYLCQGNRNGTVLLHPIQIKKSGHHTDQASVQPIEIWSDIDKMSITGLTWSSTKNILLATKGQTVIIWHLDQLDTGHPVVSFIISPAVAFKYSIHDVQLWRNDLFLSGLDGQIYKALLDDFSSTSRPDACLPLQPIDVPWNCRDWRINGLTLSANGVFLIAAISPAFYFCHLTLRKPSKIQWLRIKSLEEISKLVLNHSGSLQEVNDALAYLKFDWSVTHQWTNDIMQLLSNRDSWLTYTLYQLKLLWLLLQIQILYWKEDLDLKGKQDALAQDLLTAEEMIIHKHAQRSLDRFLDLDAAKSLTTNESRLLSVMVDFLKQKSSADDSDRINKICERFQLQSELCSICKSQVPYSSFRKATCEMGHMFSRCCQTLLLCQEIPYRVCSFCNALALPKDSNECSWSTNFTLQLNECTYCDGKLI